MILRRQGMSWSSSVFASIFIHAGIAATMAMVPMPEPKEPRRTVFAIRSAPQVAVIEQSSQTAQVPEVMPVRPQPVEASAALPADVALAAVAHQVRPGVETAVSVPVTDRAADAQTEPSMPRSEPVLSPQTAPAESAPLVAVMEALAPDAAATLAPVGREGLSSAPAEIAAVADIARLDALSVPTTAPQVVVSDFAGSRESQDAAEAQAIARPTAVEQPTGEILPQAVGTEQATPVEPPSAPAVSTPARAGSVTTEMRGTGTAVAVVRPAEPSPAQRRESPAQAYGRVVDAILGEAAYPCFMALASTPDGSIAVDGFSTHRDPIERLGTRIGQLIRSPFALRGHIVSDAQCAALAFARDLGGYPQLPLRIELDSRAIASGATLSGSIGNIDHNWVYLITVDDVGKVQEIEDLALEGAGTVGFSVPLTLTEGPAGSVQLLIAIASDDILETVWLREGERAEAYFDRLGAEIRDAGAQAAFGVASFVIER